MLSIESHLTAGETAQDIRYHGEKGVTGGIPHEKYTIYGSTVGLRKKDVDILRIRF
jgi:hypothetical protein